MKPNRSLLSRTGLLFLMCFVALTSFAADNLSFLQSVDQNFAKLWDLTQPEKAYVQTDKPYYSAGETIWLKGYVVSAVTHIPQSMSRFLYVELIDQSGAVLDRVKVKKDSVGFAGYLKLKPELQAGAYSLRAYTYWMQNSGTDYFFNKIIQVGNSIDDNVNASVNYSVDAQSKISAVVTFKNQNKFPISGKKVDVCQNWNNPDKKKMALTTDAEGKISLSLQVDNVAANARFVDVSISDPDMKYTHRFFVPELKDDFELQFMPESGVLLTNQMQMIGFKAIAANGLGLNVEGHVFNSHDEEVADFTTTYKGMGKFTLQVDPNERYYAVVKADNGMSKRFALPATIASGVSLHLLSARGRIVYEVTNQTSKPDSDFRLLLHQRGKVLALLAFKESQGQIAEQSLPAGIVSFSVVDALGNVYCERLVFVRDNAPIAVNMTTDKAVYGKREPVSMDFQLKSANGAPCLGNFSLSVTDMSLVSPDSVSGNIQSNLLLTSDLKGYVEDPGSYFTSNANVDRERLDVLMLTQGWRRFSTANAIKGVFEQPKFFMEAGQAISGYVKSALNSPSKNCGILMVSGQSGRVVMSQTDNMGRFLIDGVDFVDSTRFMLKAKKEKSFGEVELIPDKDEFPRSEVFIPYQDASRAVPDSYLWQTKQKYYMEGGMRVISLDGVTVSASKVATKVGTDFYAGAESQKIDNTVLDRNPTKGVLELLGMQPGIKISGDQVTVRGSKESPLFMIDDVEVEGMNEVKYLTAADIDGISIFDGPSASIFGSKGANGVIVIALRQGVAIKTETPPSFVSITPLGYQKPAEFYVPKYDVLGESVKVKSDLRTTIYWAPELVSDAAGNIHVKFYTADKANKYQVVLEGISANGEACHYTGFVTRKGE